MFDTLAFDQLLGTPDLGSRLVWSPARRCICFDTDGGTYLSCPICLGEAFVWSEWSKEFRAGVLGLTAKQIESMAQRLGPGMIGDASISLPPSAPAYPSVTQHDRFVALDATDIFEWSILAGTTVRLPLMANILEARVRSADKLSMVRGPVPVPDTNGQFTVAVPTVLRVNAPRQFEVLPDASQVRAIMPGLPRKVAVKLVDISRRSGVILPAPSGGSGGSTGGTPVFGLSRAISTYQGSLVVETLTEVAAGPTGLTTFWIPENPGMAIGNDFYFTIAGINNWLLTWTNSSTSATGSQTKSGAIFAGGLLLISGLVAPPGPDYLTFDLLDTDTSTHYTVAIQQIWN